MTRHARVTDVRSSRTIRESVYRDLRRSIVLGRLDPLDRLDPRKLAVNYATSITPVRDALHMLAKEGLIEIRPRLGYFVAQMTLKQLRDLLELREILECEAAARAAQRINDALLRELHKVHEGYTGDDELSVERYMDENRRFHYTVALASGNRELAETIGHILDRLARYMVLYGHDEEMPVNHGRILEALHARDPELAQASMRTEIVRFREWVLTYLTEQHSGSWQLIH